MISQDKIVIPDRDYPCEVLVPTHVLIEVCQELKGFGESVKLCITEDKMHFEASDEMVSAQISLQDREITGFGILCTEAHTQLFKCTYFIKMGKAAKLTQAPECLLQIGPDSPLSLLFQLGGIGTIQFFLAPLIDSDS